MCAFEDRPLPADSLGRFLQAGRVTGSAMNRQPRRLLVLECREARAAVAEADYVSDNLTGEPLAW